MLNTELSEQIREVVDAAPPVTAAEIYVRSARGQRARRYRPASGWHRGGRWVVSVAGALVIALAVSLAYGVGGPGPSPTRQIVHRPLILAAQRVSDIMATSSAALAATGTAQITQVQTQNGAPVSNETADATFEGQNLDLRLVDKIWSLPGGGAPSIDTVDDRLVDGQFYIYTPGPNDVLEWLHDTGSDGAASMAFPDPRTLFADISPLAELEVVGTTTSDGSTLTHLRAQDPGAIDASSLADYVSGSLTSFDIWVDQHDVVHRLMVTSYQSHKICTFTRGTGGPSPALRQHLSAKKGADVVAAPGATTRCGPVTTDTDTTIEFADIGAPESVVAPANAVNFVGKG